MHFSVGPYRRCVFRVYYKTPLNVRHKHALFQRVRLHIEPVEMLDCCGCDFVAVYDGAGRLDRTFGQWSVDVSTFSVICCQFCRKRVCVILLLECMLKSVSYGRKVAI